MSVPPPDGVAWPTPAGEPPGPPPLPPMVTASARSDAAPPLLPARGPWGFWATLGFGTLVVVAWITVQVGVLAAWAAVGALFPGAALPREVGNNGLALSLGTWIAAPVSFGLSYVFAKIRHGPPVKEYLAFRPVSGKTLGVWLLVLLVVMVLSDCMSVWLGRPIVTDFMHEAYASAGFKPLLWGALIVGAPLMEEPLFRGFVFKGIAHSRLGVPGAIILSSAAWASLHLQYDFYGMASIFVLGLLLGWARWKTGSLYTTLLMHAVTNLGATLEVLWF